MTVPSGPDHTTRTTLPIGSREAPVGFLPSHRKLSISESGDYILPESVAIGLDRGVILVYI